MTVVPYLDALSWRRPIYLAYVNYVNSRVIRFSTPSAVPPDVRSCRSSSVWLMNNNLFDKLSWYSCEYNCVQVELLIFAVFQTSNNFIRTSHVMTGMTPKASCVLEWLNELHTRIVEFKSVHVAVSIAASSEKKILDALVSEFRRLFAAQQMTMWIL